MSETPHPLLERSVRKVLYAMLRRTENPALLRERLDDHLRWMIGEERQGRIFLSGTVEPGEGPALNGLTILQAGSMDEAEAIAGQDPLIASGAVTYSLHRWTVNEGSLSLTAHLSSGTVSMG